MDLRSYQIISEWQHLAILAATELHANFSLAELARLLKIEDAKLKESMDRLISLGLIEFTQGKYKKKFSSNLVKSKDKNSGLQQFHKEMLLKAIDALDEQDNAKKYTGTITLAIDPKQIPELQEVFRSFLRKVLRVADKSKKKERVYHLSLNFFDLFGER